MPCNPMNAQGGSGRWEVDGWALLPRFDGPNMVFCMQWVAASAVLVVSTPCMPACLLARVPSPPVHSVHPHGVRKWMVACGLMCAWCAHYHANKRKTSLPSCSGRTIGRSQVPVNSCSASATAMHITPDPHQPTCQPTDQPTNRIPTAGG